MPAALSQKNRKRAKNALQNPALLNLVLLNRARRIAVLLMAAVLSPVLQSQVLAHQKLDLLIPLGGSQRNGWAFVQPFLCYKSVV